ncbi:hypothetical protein WN48_07154 [Eufriesea mexicana]|uniref:Uncharacterized protein n=1 Tax=Eufriesea mexicana TaxID=516756 RepID=A0A310SUX6_9HYME|nr:hypothetical protein WN48_07154 [Eufriesea mexicana]
MPAGRRTTGIERDAFHPRLMSGLISKACLAGPALDIGILRRHGDLLFKGIRGLTVDLWESPRTSFKKDSIYWRGLRARANQYSGNAEGLPPPQDPRREVPQRQVETVEAMSADEPQEQ